MAIQHLIVIGLISAALAKPEWALSYPKCPSDDAGGKWEVSLSTQRCYYFSKCASTWSEATIACAKRGADLFQPLDDSANSLAYSQYQNMADPTDCTATKYPAFWIGLVRRNETEFGWLDGTPLTWSNWLAPFPDTNAESYATAVTSDHFWVDQPPERKFGFICQKIDDVCTSASCMNGGTCIPAADGVSFHCSCAQSYYGPTCQFKKTAAHCPKNTSDTTWILSPDENKCYSFNSCPKIWTDAQTECLKLNGTLAEPTTNALNLFIYPAYAQHAPECPGNNQTVSTYWIGLARTDSSGASAFAWGSGTNTTFLFWATNQPDLSATNWCVYSDDNDGNWYTAPCADSTHMQGSSCVIDPTWVTTLT